MATPAFAGGPAVVGLRAGAVLLDRYELRERLERGTPDHADAGAVWRAHDLLLRRDVALRSLRTSAGRDPVGARERAHREGRAAARVHHPGLAAIYDMADLDGDVVLVTELLRGPSLAQVLAATGRLPYRRSASVGAQLADGLAAAHARGVVHGDVGPATVLLGVDDDGNLDDGAALAGLGVAGVDAAEGFADGVVGRLRAPETLHGAPVSPAADVWALGATLHLAVTGRPPAPGGADRAAGPLAGLLGAMLAPDPFARPDAGQVRVALEGVVDGLADADAGTSPAAMPPVSPAPVTPTPPAGTPAVHHAPGLRTSSGTTSGLPAAGLNPPTRTWTPRTDPRPAARDRRRLVRTGVVGAGLLAVGAVGVAVTSLPDTAATAGSTATVAAPPPAPAPAVDAPITPAEPEPPISAVPLDADPVLTAATESREDRRDREREARAERREQQREEREDRRERAREDRDDDRDRDSDRGDRDDDRGSDRGSDRDDDRGSDRGDDRGDDADRGDSDD